MKQYKDRNRDRDMAELADAFYDNLERGNCEYGGWGLDDKRPFGNSDVAYDIAEIIGLKVPEEDDLDEAHEYCDDLYNDLGAYLRKKWKERTT
jgi:hypothetical protein